MCLPGHISPASVFKHLTVLDLSDHRLSSPIPQEVLTLSMVVHLNIPTNKFTEMEVIPYPSADLQFRVLDAHANRLRGHPPISLVNVARLSSIDLSHNQVSGRIPVEYGPKPGSSWKSLFLEDNFLTGNPPPQFIDRTVAVCNSLARNCLRCPLNIRFCREQWPGLEWSQNLRSYHIHSGSSWKFYVLKFIVVVISNGISFYFLIKCGIHVEFASKIKFSGSSEGECVIICTIH